MKLKREKSEPNRLNGENPCAYSSPWADSWRRFRRNPTAMAGLVVFVTICLLCLFAPYLTRYNDVKSNLEGALEPPNWAHIFGTDYLGRDMFLRVLEGGRTTLRISFTAILLAVAAGSGIGMASGYLGGRADFLLMRAMEVLASIPNILLVIMVEAAFSWQTGKFMYAMAIAAVPPFVKLLRASVMNVMGDEYIEAARALGVNDWNIIGRHIIPNVAPAMLIHVTASIAEAVLVCTVMGYIGIGINPPTPEWGKLVFEGYSYLRTYPYTALFPCLAVILFVLSLNFVGNGLRDALDIKRNGF